MSNVKERVEKSFSHRNKNINKTFTQRSNSLNKSFDKFEDKIKVKHKERD